MHCLNAVRDDLHEYAEAIQRRMAETVHACALDFVRIGSVNCEVVHRLERFQTEVIEIAPGAVIPPHRHPCVDSVDFLWSGNVDGFDIDGRHLARFVNGMGLRIPQAAYHGGQSGREGVVFLSCQRWQRAPDRIVSAWEGRPINDRHARMLEALKAVA